MAKLARTDALPGAQTEPLAAVEEMIATLRDLRRHSNDRALQGAYQAAIDRLDALAYRLTEASAPAPPAPKPVRSAATPRRPKPRCRSAP